jgi:hypothetical protein
MNECACAGDDPVNQGEVWTDFLELRPEKREVTGSTPVPTTGNPQFRGYFEEGRFCGRDFVPSTCPPGNWNEFRFGATALSFDRQVGQGEAAGLARTRSKAESRSDP